MEVNLRQMTKNQKGIILKITAQNELGRRIREMGITPGIELKMLGEAPLYDPIAIKVRDNVLTLRNNEANYILVRIEGDINEY